MELSEVIQPHYGVFTEKVVDPVSLASKLPSLTYDDRDVIQCSRSHGRLLGVMKLHQVIIGKVTWPELYAALRKEKLTGLAEILEKEYYQQHPTAARPIPQDENLNPGVDQVEQEPTDSCGDSNINSKANSNPYINLLPEACFRAGTSSSTIYIQIGNNNCINHAPYAEHECTTAVTQCEDRYEVCVESDVTKSLLDKNESEENMLNNNSPDQYNDLPNEPTTSQSVSPQCSSSSSDLPDGGSPKVPCHSETAEHTSEKVVFQERNGDEMVYSAPSGNISSHDNTNTMSESQGHSEISDVKNCFEELGIAWRTGVKRCGEGEEEEEEETDLKKLA